LGSSTRPNLALQEVPSTWAKVSTGVSYGLPIVIGIANAREIQYRAEAGEISQEQASGQQKANVGFTVAASVGGGYIVPEAAALTSHPVGWAVLGGVCLAYDISVGQGIANNMIEGQPFWPAYIDARAEANRVFMFGHGEDFDYWLEQTLLSGTTQIVTLIDVSESQ
jgi:hypothetical protein